MKNLNRHLRKTKNNKTQNLGEKKMKAKKLILGLVALSVLSFAASVSAGVPQIINYQGVLTDPSGCPVDDGNYTIIFRIYDDSTDGDLLWDETHDAVTVTQGNFNVLLGIPDSLFLSDSLWLTVKIGNDPEMEPRQRIASVGYAFRSEFADTAEYALSAPWDDDWEPDTAGFNIYRLTGNVGIGTPSPQYKLDVADTAQMTGFKMPTDASDGYVLTSDASGVGSWQAAAGGIGGSGTANYIPKFVDTTTLGNSVMYETAGNIGIGTTSPVTLLHLSAATPKLKFTGLSYLGWWIYCKLLFMRGK